MDPEKKPIDRPASALHAYAHARRLVLPVMAAKGFESGPLFERCVDIVAYYLARRGVAGVASEVPTICEEQCRWRLNAIENELDAYKALEGSRGRVSPEAAAKGDA